MNGAHLCWQSNAGLKNLHLRAEVIAKIRAFFAQREVLEVETPLLGSSTATDPHIHSFSVQYTYAGTEKMGYLQTSPEFPMKRLLAEGSGCIYQICKAFRAGEYGRLHNPEFTLLEWYRVGFNHHQLMDEMDQLMYEVLATPPAERLSYAQVFQDYLAVDPHQASIDQLQACVKKQNLQIAPRFISEDEKETRDFWLQLLMSHCIEPLLAAQKPLFITDFPASQAALAKINPNNPLVADRFELYFRGIELANGYHELCSSEEQRQRFLEDNGRRHQLDLAPIPMDEYFLAALAQGLPACAGVALGLDRLIMLAADVDSVESVMSFTIERV